MGLQTPSGGLHLDPGLRSRVVRVQAHGKREGMLGTHRHPHHRPGDPVDGWRTCQSDGTVGLFG